jgi:hypothetical protein
MSQRTKSRWKSLRTNETRTVEKLLRDDFPNTDAYRYNPASIRVRIIDPRFEGKSTEQRDALVEPRLTTRPKPTRAEIMCLLTLYPGETDESVQAFAAECGIQRRKRVDTVRRVPRLSTTHFAGYQRPSHLEGTA